VAHIWSKKISAKPLEEEHRKMTCPTAKVINLSKERQKTEFVGWKKSIRSNKAV